MANRSKPKRSATKAATRPTEPAQVSSEYLLQVARTLGAFSNFKSFASALEQMIERDPFFDAKGCLRLCGDAPQPEFDTEDNGPTLVTVHSDRGAHGYIETAGRRDKKPFEAADLRLLGGISALVGALLGAAERAAGERAKLDLLRFMLDQMPVGILAIDERGALLLANAEARRLLRLDGIEEGAVNAEPLARFRDGGKPVQRAHFEYDGRLIYAEVREYIAGENRLSIPVLYDLSTSRQQLLGTLEREAYRSDFRKEVLWLALVRVRDEPGRAYRWLADARERLGLSEDLIQPYGADACVCAFPGAGAGPVHRALKQVLTPAAHPDCEVGVVSTRGRMGEQFEAAALLDEAVGQLEPLGEFVMPRVLVYDAYRPIYENLELSLEGLCRLQFAATLAELCEQVVAGAVDGVVVDADGAAPAELVEALKRMQSAHPDLRCIYTTFRQPEMVRVALHLKSSRPILQKPFDTDVLVAGFKTAFAS